MPALAGLLLAAPTAQAQHRSGPDPAPASLPHTFFSFSGAVGDFDGDHHADLATVEPPVSAPAPGSYRVRVHLSGSGWSTFEVISPVPGGLHLSVQDVDGDRDLDLVITTARGREPVGVWINDGSGGFSQVNPDAYPGSIWHDPKYLLEPPEGAAAGSTYLFPSTDGWSPASGGARLTPATAPPLVSTSNRRPPAVLLHRAGPFRAPPLA